MKHATDMQAANALERHKVTGYLIVGGILLLIGALLMVLATQLYKPVLDIQTVQDVRNAFAQDKKRDAMFGSGVALLTTGALMFFGFGMTAVVADRLLTTRAPTIVSTPNGDTK